MLKVNWFVLKKQTSSYYLTTYFFTLKPLISNLKRLS